MQQILVANAELYKGKYVATSDWGESKVISSSVKAIDAYKTAKDTGCKEPVIFYIPKDDETTLLTHSQL
jgi:hypothetical protein